MAKNKLIRILFLQKKCGKAGATQYLFEHNCGLVTREDSKQCWQQFLPAIT